ncbi:hypothetical protein J2777_002436 [Paraburkholderia graminis]|uniref:hypothetical protein n=1 Tax=Paraburkholderia graminis TaxID=60548 RepID=UPI002854D5AA|nr:hypothetical protein [Paraburkholderia graminis]MDR6468708.1 hypothetical protein [Paraburkholderia graminis]
MAFITGATLLPEGDDNPAIGLAASVATPRVGYFRPYALMRAFIIDDLHEVESDVQHADGKAAPY